MLLHADSRIWNAARIVIVFYNSRSRAFSSRMTSTSPGSRRSRALPCGADRGTQAGAGQFWASWCLAAARHSTMDSPGARAVPTAKYKRARQATDLHISQVLPQNVLGRRQRAGEDARVLGAIVQMAGLRRDGAIIRATAARSPRFSDWSKGVSDRQADRRGAQRVSLPRKRR